MSGSRSSSARCSGCVSSATTAFPIRLTVVSCPATMRSEAMLVSSCSESVSPPSSTATSALIRSSAGSLRRCSKSAWRYATNCAIDSKKCACSSGANAGRTNASDHSRNWSRSAIGTPSSSAITVIGSGNANVETSSISPSATTGSRRPSAISWMRGRRCSIIRGVKAFETRRRSRLWSAPSRSSMWLLTHSIASGNSAWKAASRSGSIANRGSRTKRSSSSSTASTSS